jgi:tRNA A-37 threonylcarbamoyl transferase component Bud32
MNALETLYGEILKVPLFRDAPSTCRGFYGEYFVKLCRSREKRFLLRNEARIAERFRHYDFCPPLVGFGDYEDASFLVYKRVPGVSVRNIYFMTQRIISLVSETLERINETLANERICQLDPSPNNIIIDTVQGRVWYVDFELCAPFGTETEIIESFGLRTDEERQVLKHAFQEAGCSYKPAHIVEYGDAYNRYMNALIINNLKRRQHFTGFLKFLLFRTGQYWQRVKLRLG